jgi:hypothetical protein
VARKDRLIWNGDEAMEQINREMLRRLFAAAITVEKHAKVLVGKEGTGRRVKAGLSKEGERRKRVKRARSQARTINKARKTYNRIAKKAGRISIKAKQFKKTVRVTKSGKLTTRKRPKPRKKP